MAMDPLKVANVMAQAAQQKAQQPGKKNPKQVAAAKEQDKAKGKPAPKSANKPPMQGGM